MKKICKECGKEFEATSNRQVYCKGAHYRPCPVCGKLVAVTAFADPPRTCSYACMVELTRQRNVAKYGVADAGNTASALEKRRQTNLKRYGTADAGNRPEAKEKRRQTNLERYGVENAGASDVAKQHRLQTNLDRYGVDNVMKSAEVQHKAQQTLMNEHGVSNPRHLPDYDDKVRQTSLIKYGVEHYLASPEVRQKAKHTMLQRYGTIYPTQLASVQEKTIQTTISRYGVSHYSQTPQFRKAYESTMLSKYGVTNGIRIPGVQERIRATNIERYGVPYAFLSESSMQKARATMLDNMKHHISSYNRAFGELLSSAGISYEFEYPLKGKFYDIYVPSCNTLIEIDPTYTHSTQPSFYYPNGDFDPKYHKNKTMLAEENGYRCIHVFDWDDVTKIVAMLTSKQSMYARTLHVEFIQESDASEFLSTYHLQGACNGQLICIGLVDDSNTLFSVMTFGEPRYSHKYEWELLRYATMPDYRIPGGASKMFHKFVSELSPQSIISYCNRAKFNGQVYIQLGMKLLRHNAPSKVWSKESKAITDALLRQRGFDQLFGTHFGKGTDNEQLMVDAGWRSVYDCGQDVYVYMKPEDFR